MEWKTIERPGYLGKKRDEICGIWDHRFGKGNWRLAWEWGEEVLARPMALQIYEDAYYEYLRENNDALVWLMTTASDVYDTAESNIDSRFDYNKQETINNHIHDIAIRKAVIRNGVWVGGDHLVCVRGSRAEGKRFNPHMIPFHLPNMILDCDVGDYGNNGAWWREKGIEKSVEEFYQLNKVLQARE